MPEVTKGRVRRIDHVGIVVRDVMTAADWWTQRLGMSLVHVADVLDDTIRLAYLDLGDTTVQLVQPLRDGPIRDWLDTSGEGLHHICFLVDGEIRDALRLLDDRGGRHMYQGGRGAAVCFLGDTPCGVLVELTEVTPATWSPDGTLAVTMEGPAPSA